MSGSFHTGAASGLLLLADISGYTGFLQAVDSAHGKDMYANGEVPPAYPLMTTLLEGIIGSVVPPFTLSKLEGDAVFAFAVGLDDVPRAAALLAFLQACYDAFLLKNGGAALLGQLAYALLTDAATAQLDVPIAGSIPMAETYEHYQPIEVRLFPLR